MSEAVTIFLWTLGAGSAIPVGAALASVERIKPNWLEEEFRHFVIAFGGGALLSAVALVLIPEGIEKLSITATVICFLAGGISFLAIDFILAARETGAAQLVAMLADLIPEAIALGATFSLDSRVGSLLAVLIALQNLPEGFNAYREIISSTSGRKVVIIGLFVALAFLGPRPIFKSLFAKPCRNHLFRRSRFVRQPAAILICASKSPILFCGFYPNLHLRMGLYAGWRDTCGWPMTRS